MAVYIWCCQSCKTDTEVERPMKDYEVPPDEPCKCGAKDFRQVIRPKKNVKGFILSDRFGGHDFEYGKRGPK